jgi:hypothetical protein
MDYTIDEINVKLQRKALDFAKELQSTCVIVIVFDAELKSFTGLGAVKDVDLNIISDGVEQILKQLREKASELEHEQQIQE